MKKLSWTPLHDHVAELKQQNKVAQRQQDMRAKGAETSNRMLGMLLGSLNETVMKAMLVVRTDCVTRVKMERIREKMREENRKKKRGKSGCLPCSWVHRTGRAYIVCNNANTWLHEEVLRVIVDPRKHMKVKGFECF